MFGAGKTYTFMDGYCRQILRALHRREGLPGSERFDRSVNFFPQDVGWLIFFGFIRREDNGELVLTERGRNEEVFFEEDNAITMRKKGDEWVA